MKCRIGEERQTAIQLMRKMIAYQFSDEVMLKMGVVRGCSGVGLVNCRGVGLVNCC